MPDAQLPDIQSQSDNRNIPLDRVGIKDLLWPVTVLDRKNGTQTTVAKVSMYVNLPHDFRGAHMSRFVEVLNKYKDREWFDHTHDILKTLREDLEAEEAHMEIEFPYFIEKISPVSAQKSLMSYTCHYTASYLNGEDAVLQVTVPVITLCPCSKEISEHGAHNQRCMVNVQIRYSEFVWIEELIELVEASASGSLYSILKRPDEKYITEQAFSKPMFVEDVVREIALKLNNIKRITSYVVEAESHESIHNHNAYAMTSRS